MKADLIEVTPEMAKKWLENQNVNRKLSKSTVHNYKKEMIDGNWKLTHQAIAFDRSGRLVDGQHRLSALIDFGKPVKLLCVFGVENEACIAIDEHKRRDKCDAITISGFPASKEMVSVASLFWWMNVRVFRNPTVHEVKSILQKNEKDMRFMDSNKPGKARSLSVAQFYAAVVIAHKFMPEQRLKEFMTVFSRGKSENSADDEAAITMRNWLINNHAENSQRGQSQRIEIIDRILYAMEKFNKKEPMKACRMPVSSPFGYKKTDLIQEGEGNA